jgi:K+-transporting ATPase ATPase B chain
MSDEKQNETTEPHRPVRIVPERKGDEGRRPVRTRPERDADPTRGLEPPSQRTPETAGMKETAASRRAGQSVWTWPLVRSAIGNAFRKLDPRLMARNPVMFVVEIGSVLTAFWAAEAAFSGEHIGFEIQITAWLWFTVLFANFAEAMAEARGKAQADTLRATKKETPARVLRNSHEESVSSSDLRKGDIVLIREGEIVPGDGEVIEGVAYVNEAAITGESAPVLKEPGTDIRSGVTGGTQVVSDWLKVRITADPGQTFLDRMISLVEGAQRQKTPNEIALTILLSALSLIFLIVVVTLQPFAVYAGDAIDTIVLIALLVCLLPTTIGALLSAIGIAGMDRVTRFNVLAMSGRAVETAGDVDVLLLDKTGTITYGNRLAAEIMPIGGASREDAVKAALWSSLGDETPEGRSIVALARQLGAEAPGGSVDARRARRSFRSRRRPA